MSHGITPSVSAVLVIVSILTHAVSGMNLGREHSVGPGESVRFAFGGSIVFEDGFHLNGGSAEFLLGGDQSKTGTEAPQPMIGMSALVNVSLNVGLLQVDYHLSEASPVSLEVFASNGRLLKKWVWETQSPGIHSRTLEFQQAPGGGIVMLRWTSGDNRMIQRLPVR